METERFDDEIRRKLLSLPENLSPDADSQAREAARIQAYVATHQTPPRFGSWGRLTGYVVGGGVLLTSLLYNLHQRNSVRRLQSTLDSLNGQTAVSKPVLPRQNRVDTVYVTLSDNPRREETIRRNKELNSTQNTDLQKLHEENFTLNAPDSRAGTNRQPVLTDTVLWPGYHRRADDVPARSGRVNRRERVPLPAVPLAVAEPGIRPASTPRDSAMGAGSPETADVRVVGTTTEKRVSTLARQPQRSAGKPPKSAGRAGSIANTYARVEVARNRTGQPVAESSEPSLPVDVPSSGLPVGSSRFAPQLVLLRHRPMDTVWHQPDLQERVVWKPLPINPATATATVRPHRRVSMPTVSMKNKGYLIGTDFQLTTRQLGGSLLGEMRLNSRWSLQTGLGYARVSGEKFATNNDYHDTHGNDFDRDHLTGLPPGTDLSNIDQHYTILQVPVMIGYFRPISKQWGLRLGFGTGVDVAAWQAYHFETKDKGHDDKHSLSLERQTVTPFNNLNLTVGAERSWKHWLVRVGPLAGWQWQSVGYRPDKLSVGGRLQVFYRLGR